MFVETQTIRGGKPEFGLPWLRTPHMPDAYDGEPAKQQALEQKSLARQSIFQFQLKSKPKTSTAEDVAAVSDWIISLLKTTLIGMHILQPPEEDSTKSIFDVYSNVGDGLMVVCHEKMRGDGLVIAIWDGGKQINVNFKSWIELDALSDTFVDIFLATAAGKLMLMIRDDQPRGTGNVVTFSVM